MKMPKIYILVIIIKIIVKLCYTIIILLQIHTRYCNDIINDFSAMLAANLLVCNNINIKNNIVLIN